jgi:predicted MPP superfamily phosphohydrolase
MARRPRHPLAAPALVTAPRRLIHFGSRPEVIRYDLRHARWTLPPITLAVLADLHAIVPWTPIEAVERIVAQTNALAPDMILLLGDYIASRRMPGLPAKADDIAAALAQLRAPLGVQAVLGNHDWRDCAVAVESAFTETAIERAFDRHALPLLRNGAVRVPWGDSGFWVVGLDSQLARHGDRLGFHDPELAFAEVPGEAPTLLLAHEPDYFALHDDRALLQVSGHTHGGQINLFGMRPLTPSAFGNRFAYGHHLDAGRHLVVSGGLGFSGAPVRLSQPPEITLIRLGPATRAEEKP